MGELRLCLDQDFQDATWQTRLVRPGDGQLGTFQPGAGVAMGYDDLKVVEAHRLVESISTGVPHGATIEDAVVTAELVDAMVRSHDERRWVSL
jgi:predicted dehydrogenase